MAAVIGMYQGEVEKRRQVRECLRDLRRRGVIR